MSLDDKPPPAKTAAEICGKFELSKDAAKLLDEKAKPQPFLDLLIQKALFADAVQYLTQTLSIREAIWWATVCSKPEPGPAPPAPVADAHKGVDAWVHEPDDDKRRAAHAAAEIIGAGTPVGMACMAIFFSGGSMGPKDLKPIPPPAGLARHMAANSVILASVIDPPKTKAKFTAHLALGQDVAAGKNRWKEKTDKKEQPRK